MLVGDVVISGGDCAIDVFYLAVQIPKDVERHRGGGAKRLHLVVELASRPAGVFADMDLVHRPYEIILKVAQVELACGKRGPRLFGLESRVSIHVQITLLDAA